MTEKWAKSKGNWTYFEFAGSSSHPSSSFQGSTVISSVVQAIVLTVFPEVYLHILSPRFCNNGAGMVQ